MNHLIKTLILGTALGLGSCQNSQMPAPVETSAEESALNTIMTRTSVRQYTDQIPDSAVTEKILRAGMAAPTAADRRPWTFIVVTDTVTKNAIAGRFGATKPAARAPQVLVVCANLVKTLGGDGRDYWIEDCSAAMENMLLAAHALGLGAVWMGVYPQKEKVDFLKELLEIPSWVTPLGMMAVGYPAENPPVKDKYDPSLIHQEKW